MSRIIRSKLTSKYYDAFCSSSVQFNQQLEMGIKPCDRLRHFRKNGSKRTVDIFSKFKDKLVPHLDSAQIRGFKARIWGYEVDLIIGHQATGYDNLLTFNERKSRKLFIKRVISKNPMKIILM